jgi:hypothetical protein
MRDDNNGNVLVSLSGNMDGFLLTDLLIEVLKILEEIHGKNIHVTTEDGNIVIRNP